MDSYKLEFVLPSPGTQSHQVEHSFVMLLSQGYDARVRARYRREVVAWNSGNATWLSLQWIFALGGGYPQLSDIEHAETILALGRQKLVQARVVRLVEPPRSVAIELEQLLSRHRYHEADHSQGPEKRQALYWLSRRGARNLHAEGDYVAGRYDVAAEDLGVLVECGTTRLDKLLKASLCMVWREFVIVPRGLHIAVVFDFKGRLFNHLRHLVEQAHDRIRFLDRACQEPRITRTSLARCLVEANHAHRARWKRLGEIADRLRAGVS